MGFVHTQAVAVALANRMVHTEINNSEGFNMKGPDGMSAGRCVPAGEARYECPKGKRQDHGYGKFRCVTLVNAETIANAK
jgi:hypothetical protein